MTARFQSCPPGSHPHADRRNWRPADNIDDFFRNCQDGLETYSDRKAAKLMGISRVELWRWKMMACLPDDLFEGLLNGRYPSTKSLAAVAVALKNSGPIAEVERCPHCGGRLRLRPSVSRENSKIVAEWINKRKAGDRAP